ncbi:hypothetical protein V9L05_07570 [Bernardetia sp. Wsw4-3y2]|uniref:hypothetical protein n=1 Tax=Bernardetia sp. Wsw4-3y2 TaxID=3127471 RepID=UPI0030D4FE4B
MLDSTKAILKLTDIGRVCRELNAICIDCKDNDLEQFNYYSSMFRLLLPEYEFLHSEAKIQNDLQTEIWEKERIKRENSSYYLEGKRLTYEAEEVATDSKKTTPVVEQIICTTEPKKMPFERQVQFNFFGYKIYSFLEIEKM